MRLYNTLTRTEEEFTPSQDNLVRMYACGLTVYSRGHIGNFRTFVAVDVLRRTLRYLGGYTVRQVMNFTDVDDRTIAGSQKAGMPLREYTEPVDRRVSRGRRGARPRGRRRAAAGDRPGQPRGDGAARAGARSERPHLRERRLGLLQDLRRFRSTAAGAARSRRPEGRRPRRLGQVRQGQRARLRAVEGDARPDEPSWDFGFGRAGRAGTSSARRWRCGCSASRRSTSTAAASISSSRITRTRSRRARARPDKPFARFWMHGEHLLIDEEKMSKSLGNVFTLPDIVAKGYRPSTLRYLLLSTHYRKQLKFSWDAMSQAEEALRRLADFVERLDRVTADGTHPEIAAKVAAAEARVHRRRWSSDLNTAGALGAIFELVRDAEHGDRQQASSAPAMCRP